MAMNGDLSTQVGEGLATVRKLQESKQELQSRAARLARELEAERRGAQAELHNHWRAEDEVLTLQSELEETEAALAAAAARAAAAEREAADALAEVSRLREGADNLDNELRAARAESETKDSTILKLVKNCQENSAAVTKACAEAEAASREAAEVGERLAEAEARKGELEEEAREGKEALERQAERNKEMEGFLEEYMKESAGLKEKVEALRVERDELAKK